MNILQINSSIQPNGQSTRLAEELVSSLGGKAVVRDLGRDPLPHLNVQRMQKFGQPDPLIDELKSADVLVLGAPMYNFGVSSQLKAWIDHVARAGVTFRYTAAGPEGLLKGKKAYVIATRGGVYAGTGADTQTPYLRQLLGFLGITDVEFIYAEGLALSAESREKSLQGARARIATFAPKLAA